jgi:hypothetical protein
MDLIAGPPRDGFDAIIAHEHLAKLDEFATLDSPALDRLRDDLVALVYRASSLQVSDPVRHLRPLLTGGSTDDPALAAKRLQVTTVFTTVGAPNRASAVPYPFEFPGTPALALGTAARESVLVQKLARGGCGPTEIEDLREKERAAEAHLIEDALRHPERYPKLLRQLEAMVFGECSEAFLRASLDDGDFGKRMLVDVQDRLRLLASERPQMIGHKEYECLMGVVALLTTECRLWWSPRFPIGDTAA